MNITMETKIREWYMKEYAHDTNGKNINPEITFGEYNAGIWGNENVYEMAGVECQEMRERLFTRVARIRRVAYYIVHDEWVFSDL